MMFPTEWFWLVADGSRVWSSAVGAYVETMPDGVGFTRIDTEENLTDVLSVYGLPGPVIRVPSSVSPAQAEIALYRYDNGVLLGQVNDVIAFHPYEPVRIWWRKATYISRDHPYLQALALELDLSDETVDALFIEALST